MRSLSRRSWATGLAALSLLVACGADADERCREVSLAPGVEPSLREVADRQGWPVVLPCAAGSGFVATSVLASEPAGGVQVTVVVTRRGTHAFTFTQAAALPAWRDIPRGTRYVSVDAGGVKALGYEGPSGSGATMLYLRWEVENVAFELQAAPSAGWPLRAARADAGANIERTVAALGRDDYE